MTFRAACIQMNSGPDVAANISAQLDLMAQAVDAGAELVLAPESAPAIVARRVETLARAVTEAEHPALAAYRDFARQHKIWLMPGSISVRLDDANDDRLANRAYVIGPDGEIKIHYDKIHMFDVDIPDGQVYRESDAFRPGETAKLVRLPWGKLGMSICYDMRFAPLYRGLALAGADFICVPAAFTRFTGQSHWHVLLRARAIETGCYVFAPAQCGTHDGGRETYGHSLIIAPWGEVMADAGGEVGFVMADIDPAAVQKARNMVPNLKGARDFGLEEAG